MEANLFLRAISIMLPSHLPAAGTWTLRVRHEGNSGTLMQSVKLLPGQTGYGTPDADDPLTPENEATLPRYRLDSGGVQPFSIVVDGNTPSNADALRITSYSQAASQHTLTWQSTKGVVYLVERSFDLQTWAHCIAKQIPPRARTSRK